MGYEEPENGVHPRRLKLIADLLHHAAEANEHLQILINTHSPVLPEYFDPQSLIVCRKEGRESKFIPFSHFQMNDRNCLLINVNAAATKQRCVRPCLLIRP
ncbi:MAG: ATP-binding protein [Chloroflexi bacterium]|nr:ATP-binding protein [Chloroflexota bacterium]MBP8058231.1 ATP-binding protein [Chloroflexota bacterium]